MKIYSIGAVFTFKIVYFRLSTLKTYFLISMSGISITWVLRNIFINLVLSYYVVFIFMIWIKIYIYLFI